jgi:hypothetical protein
MQAVYQVMLARNSAIVAAAMTLVRGCVLIRHEREKLPHASVVRGS